jgi:protein O-mannosyl-transferase
MMFGANIRNKGLWLLTLALAITALVYWPGLSGSYLFDDYPNIVDNLGVQPTHATLATLTKAAVSSPASEFKRPLASLSFAANFLVSGLDPFWMKLTNLVIHLINGVLAYLFARALLQSVPADKSLSQRRISIAAHLSIDQRAPSDSAQISITAALIAAGWMLLPINLTSVLYVVQRMESMANLFVLLGLTGYVLARQRMLSKASCLSQTESKQGQCNRANLTAYLLCACTIAIPTAAGLLAKETAVMLPLYALLVEWVIFRFRLPEADVNGNCIDWRIVVLFLTVLVLPCIAGLSLLLPHLLNPEAWATRDFTLHTRLLSEPRIVLEYMRWTLLPTFRALSFYHDEFNISTGLLSPWTTTASILALALIAAFAVCIRTRRPLIALGIMLFLGCHVLTATIVPLELIYEHRNYFASFGLMLAVVPALAGRGVLADTSLEYALPRRMLLAGLFVAWFMVTAITARAWSSPLTLAQELASRAPNSPRAQYELGRAYIIYSHYDAASPFARLAYAPLERAASLPRASILAEQALIFFNAHLNLPSKDAWWDSLVTKLGARKPGVQDESSLGALVQCSHEGACNLPKNRMIQAFLAALSHPKPSARLLAIYADYSWNVLDDRPLALQLAKEACAAAPKEEAYWVTLAKMQSATGDEKNALESAGQLKRLNMAGSLNTSIEELNRYIESNRKTTKPSG